MTETNDRSEPALAIRDEALDRLIPMLGRVRNEQEETIAALKQQADVANRDHPSKKMSADVFTALTERSHIAVTELVDFLYEHIAPADRHEERHNPTPVAQLLAEISHLTTEISKYNPRLQDARSTPPAIPDAFASGQGLMSSSLALQGVLASLRSAQADRRGWREGDGGMPDFEFTRDQGIALVMMRPGDDTPPGQAIATQLWEHVAKLSDLDGDVFLAMMAQALGSAEKHADGSSWITASAILNYRGIKPKRYSSEPGNWQHGHRTEDVQEIGACVSRLRRIRVELRSVDVREPAKGRRKPKIVRTSHEGYLFTVDEVVMQGELGGDRHAIGWRFRLGRCITEFLNGPNRQVATLVQKVLTYDHYRERFEKRLGLYFTIHRRIAASYRAPLRRTLTKLFDELVLDLDERNPSRSRERFEKAMTRLTDDGVIPGWRYTPESQARIDKLPPRKWLRDWLACVVEIPVAAAELKAAGV